MVLKFIIEKLKYNYHGIYKNKFKKPFLLNNLFNISISHCFPAISILLNNKKNIGIDIQIPGVKLKKIKKKFKKRINLFFTKKNLYKICIYWSIAEAIYKICNKNIIIENNIKLSFKKEKNIIFLKIYSKYYIINYCLYYNYIVIICQKNNLNSI